MQVTLKYPLYKRTQPSNEGEALGFQPEGTTLEVCDIVQGKAIDGNSNWIKAKDGFHYWQGGINKDEWWITDLGVSAFWDVTRGGDMTIAMLDSGLSKHKDLNLNAIIGGHNFLADSDNFFLDENHCTHLAGIIAGQGAMVTGVAPETKLWIGKILDAGGMLGDNIPLLKKALQYILDNNQKFDIINISVQIPPVDYLAIPGFQQDIETLVKSISDRFGSIIVASIGNFSDVEPIPINSLPSFAKGVFAVTGSTRLNGLCDVAGLSDKIDIASPGQDISSLAPVNTIVSSTGTSQAAAFTSGIFALAKSYWLSQKPGIPFDAAKLQEIFRQAVLPMEDHRRFGQGIIQPLKIKNQIDLL